MQTRPMTKVQEASGSIPGSGTYTHNIYENVAHADIYPMTDLALRTTSGVANWKVEIKNASAVVLFTKTLTGHDDYHMTAAVKLPAEHCTIVVTNNDDEAAEYLLTYTVMR
jgi:hypothetical protein